MATAPEYPHTLCLTWKNLGHVVMFHEKAIADQGKAWRTYHQLLDTLRALTASDGPKGPGGAP